MYRLVGGRQGCFHSAGGVASGKAAGSKLPPSQRFHIFILMGRILRREPEKRYLSLLVLLPEINYYLAICIFSVIFVS